MKQRPLGTGHTAGQPLVTERLRLRAWHDSDVALLVAMSSDQQVVHYVGDGQPWAEARARVVAASVATHWTTHGFGWRVIELVSDLDEPPLGLACLNYLGDGAAAGVAAEEIEIGWWLWPGVWHHGYATEAGTAIRDEALDRLGSSSLVARIQAENTASRNVAKRLGMDEDHTTTGRFGEPILLYRFTADPSNGRP